MKTTKKQSDMLVKEKRISLRCPLTIDRTEAEYLSPTPTLPVHITLGNTGGGGLTNDTAESVIIVLRLYNEAGNPILFAGNDYIAKSIRLGTDGLPAGEQITFRIYPDRPSEESIHDAEVYISRVRYADGTTTDYVRGDFFDLPEQAVPLTKKFKKNMDEAMKLLGEGALYVPEQFSEIVWRCTCGELAESDACPACGRKKSEVFDALDQLIVPTIKVIPPYPAEKVNPLPIPEPSDSADGETAEYAISPRIIAAKANLDNNPPPSGDTAPISIPKFSQNEPSSNAPEKKTRRKHSRSTIALLIAIGISSVVFVALLVALIIAIQNKDTAAESTTPPPIVTDPAPENIVEQIVRTYLDANDFDNALGFATQNNLGGDLLDEIYTKAIQYYTNLQNPEKALEFARRQKNAEKIGELLSVIFEKQMTAEDYESAMETAESLPEAQKADAQKRAAEGYVKTLIADEEYAKAMDVAGQYQTPTTQKQISQIAIGAYMSENDYDRAMGFADAFDVSEQIPVIAKKAALYYAEVSNLPRAMEYLKLADDEETTRSIYVQLSDFQIRRYLPTFFGYLDFSKKQAIHASPIAAQPDQMIVLDQMGNIFQGEEMIYDAEENGKIAVSIAACDTAVIALLSDGTVRMINGENAYYNQTDLDDWSNIVAISAGNYHILGLTKSGTVLSAGRNTLGQCDTSEIQNAVMISAGANHSLILLSDGTVISLGLELDDERSTDDWSDIVAISAGVTHSIGIRADGTAVSIGNCDVSTWKNVIAVVSGGSSAVGITTDHKVHYVASGKPSNLMAGYESVLWVSVRQNFIGVLNLGGNLSGIGLVGAPPAGIPLFTDLFGMQ